MVNNKWLDKYIGARNSLTKRLYWLDGLCREHGPNYRTQIINKLLECGIINRDTLAEAESLREINQQWRYRLSETVRDMSIELDGANIEDYYGCVQKLKKPQEYDNYKGKYAVDGNFVSYIDDQRKWQVTIASKEIIQELEEKGYQEAGILVPINDRTRFINPELEEKKQDLLETDKMQQEINRVYGQYIKPTAEMADIVDINVFLSQLGTDIKRNLDIEGILTRISQYSMSQGVLYSQNENIQAMKDTSEINLNEYSYDKWKDTVLRRIEENIEMIPNAKKLFPYMTLDEIVEQNMFQNIGIAQDFVPSTLHALDNAHEGGINVSEDIKNINLALLPLGMSYIQLKWNMFEDLDHPVSVKDWEKGPRQQKRMLENCVIEEFLGSDTERFYEEDIVFTNVNRIKTIIERMASGELGDNQMGNLALQYASKHLSEDLIEFGSINKEQVELMGNDYEQYIAKLDRKLLEIGLSLKDFNEEDLESSKHIDITKKIFQQYKIRKFIKMYGSDLGQTQGDDIVMQKISQIEAIENILLQQNRELCAKYGESSVDVYKKGQYGEDFFADGFSLEEYLHQELAFYLDDGFKDMALSQGINWQEYEINLNRRLQNFGVNAKDFFPPTKIKSDDGFDWQSSGLTLEEYIKICRRESKAENVKLLTKKMNERFDARFNNIEDTYNIENLTFTGGAIDTKKSGYEDCMGDESLRTSFVYNATKKIREDIRSDTKIRSSTLNGDREN